MAANASAITTNASGVATNVGAITTNASDIAANAADLLDIANNYLPELDDLFTYVSTDTTAATIDIVGATLDAEQIYGASVRFRDCGGSYTCTPMACKDLCIANGERMAFIDEVYAWASAGQDSCAWAWMLDRNDMSGPTAGFPMYFNRTTGGCGVTNTGDVPRIIGPSPAAWSSATTWDCACATVN